MNRPYVTNIIYDSVFDEDWSVYDYKNASAIYGMITLTLYTGAFACVGIAAHQLFKKRFKWRR